MNFRLAVFVAAGLWSAAAAGVAVRAGSQAMDKTTNDGVFSEAQAKRGEPLYQQYCGSCHGATLNGGEMAPPLTGGEFVANWNDLSVGDLFERIRISMPANDPGSLSRQQNADIVAYMLHFERYPPGANELPRETETLKTIKIVPVKGQ
jgi:mono/diheme cytochrome c family protein